MIFICGCFVKIKQAPGNKCFGAFEIKISWRYASFVSLSMKTRVHIENTILIILGILSAGMGIKGFLLSTRFIDGGVTGISMLLSKITGLPISILIFGL